MSATSSRTRTTAAFHTFIIRAIAASGVLAMLLARIQCAWLAKPRSLARSARCCRTRRRVAKIVRQSREIGFVVDDERVALFVGQLVLAEDREKTGETLVDLLQTRLFRFAKRRTPTGEARVDDFGESLLLEGE